MTQDADAAVKPGEAMNAHGASQDGLTQRPRGGRDRDCMAATGNLPPRRNDTLVLKSAEGECATPVAEFLSRLGIRGLVKMRQPDFAALPAVGGRFTHFVLPPADHIVGSLYAILPIIRPGSRLGDGTENLPLLDPACILLGRCEQAMARVSYDTLAGTLPDHLLPGIDDVSDLKKIMLSRYALLFPYHAHSAILLAGVAISTFVIENKASYPPS